MRGRRNARTLAVVAWALALALSAPLYHQEDALRHFAWHLSYGSAAGLVAAAGVLVWQRGLPGNGALWALAGYAYMVVPDVLWLAPTLVGRPPWEHEQWMDVFLAHVSLDGWGLATAGMAPALAVGLGALLWARAHVGTPTGTARSG